jgi:death-on-curing protein
VIEPAWIDQRDAVTLRDSLLALNGGSQGTRDRSLLQSALARPHQLLACGSEYQVI